MAREHNLTIDTVAASRGQRTTNSVNDSSSDNDADIILDDDYDDDDDLTSSPSVIDEEINYDLVYALHTFSATVEGQASVEKGESLTLLDESNSYWWLVKVLRNDEVGYIPAENVETPYEKLARLNKHRNINVSSSQNNTEEENAQSKLGSRKKQGKGVRFKSPEFNVTIEYEEEGEEEMEFGEEQYEETKDSNDPKEQKDRVEVEVTVEQEEPIVERRESADSVLTASSTTSTTASTITTSTIITTTQEVNVVTTQAPEMAVEDERLRQQKITAENVQPTESNSFAEQTNYYSRSNQKENPGESGNIEPIVKPVEPINPPPLSPEVIFDKSSETIKMTLTPALGSDFIDFSDDEDEGTKQKTGSKFFGKNDNDSSKTNNSLSSSKQTTTDATEGKKNKGKKEKNEGRGIFKTIFSIGKKSKNNKKDNDSSRQSIDSITNKTQPNQTRSLTYQQQMANSQRSNTNQSNTQPGWQQQQSSNVQTSRSIQPSTQKMVQQQQQTPNKQVVNPIQSQTQVQSVNQSPTTIQQQSTRPGQSPTQIPSPPKSTHQLPTQTKQPDQSQISITQQRQIGSIQTEQFNDSEAKRSSNVVKPSSSAYSVVRIFAGQNIPSKVEFKIVLLSQVTNAISLIKQAIKRFKLDNEENWDDYYITIKESDREPHHLMPHDYPLEVFETLTSSYLTPLPTVKRASISSISSNFSNLSSHEAISKLLFRDDKNLVCLYINKKLKTDSKTNSLEARFRVRVLVYSDDLPAHLRHKGSVPRVSMSVPRHLIEKAARRRSREEGKPREKVVNVTGKTSVGQIVEKAMLKFGISDGVVDDGEPISGSDDGKPRYYLMVIVNGEEKYLHPETNVMSLYKSPPDLRHFSIDSLDSTSSSTFDYRPDEPIFVLRLLRPEDHQKRAMPQSASEDIKRYTQNVNITQTSVNRNFTLTPTDDSATNEGVATEKNDDVTEEAVAENNDGAVEGAATENGGSAAEGSVTDELSRKKLIEQQREYSRAKQKSILAARKNEEQGVDIITSIGAIRSSRIFGSKIRYSFIPTYGDEVDISDLIEDVWGDDELATLQDASSNPNGQLQDKLTRLEDGDDTSDDKRASKRKSRTADVDILENIVSNGKDGDDTAETETIEERINRVIQKVKAGQYGRDEIPSLSAALRNQNTEKQSHKLGENEGQSSPMSTPVQPPSISPTMDQSNEKQDPVSSDEESFELGANEHFKDGTLAQTGAPKPMLIDGPSNSSEELTEPDSSNVDLERPASSISNRSASTINLESMTPAQGSSSTTRPVTEGDWILSDEFGLQELMVLVRSGMNMLEVKDRRRSGWSLNEDPEKILEQVKPSDIRNEIKAVFAGINDELDKLESELDQIMSDVVRVF